MKNISKIILCFVSTFEKHLQSNQYQDLFFEIRYIRTKYVYFLFRLNFYVVFFFIKPWRNRLCIWIISEERVDLDCINSGSLPFKLTTIGEVWRNSGMAKLSFADDKLNMAEMMGFVFGWQEHVVGGKRKWCSHQLILSSIIYSF